jgi:oxygen-independent coproporphyrinogen-3 oxidase
MAGIYIHIPFCKKACHYCDFHFSTSLKNKELMLEAICKELQLRSVELEDETIETIYFGGGTPSLLSVEEITNILIVVSENYSVIENPEISLEANPDDLTEEKIIALSKTSINRLSIGIQSFFEEDLKMMNRAHTSIESENCLKIATQYFENITIDLIYGVPNMSDVRWKQNLQKAFDLKVNHISSYALTVEDNTALASFIKKKQYPPLDENLALEHFNTLVRETEKNGFIQYEISNFGKPDYFSKHNTSYWKGVKYVGVGPSAHSFNIMHRSWNISNNSKYIRLLQSDKLALESEELTIPNRFNEYVMTGLRTVYGVSLEKISVDFGPSFEAYLLKEIKPFLLDGTLIEEGRIIKTTKKGKFLADGIASQLFYV